MKLFKHAKTLALCLLSFIFTFSSYAGVRSSTIELDAMDNGVKIGKKVIVECSFGYGKREIVKKDNQDQWCDTNFEDICSSRKNVATRLVCNSDYQARLTQQKNTDSEEVAKLKQELMDIEQKRLDIADKVLELKRRELELKDDA